MIHMKHFITLAHFTTNYPDLWGQFYEIMQCAYLCSSVDVKWGSIQKNSLFSTYPRGQWVRLFRQYGALVAHCHSWRKQWKENGLTVRQTFPQHRHHHRPLASAASMSLLASSIAARPCTWDSLATNYPEMKAAQNSFACCPVLLWQANTMRIQIRWGKICFYACRGHVYWSRNSTGL